MGLLHLVLREIRFRWLSFGLGVLSVTAAVGCLAAAVAMGRMLGEEMAGYEELLAKGRKAMSTTLWNGAWFVQKV